MFRFVYNITICYHYIIINKKEWTHNSTVVPLAKNVHKKRTGQIKVVVATINEIAWA